MMPPMRPATTARRARRAPVRAQPLPFARAHARAEAGGRAAPRGGCVGGRRLQVQEARQRQLQLGHAAIVEIDPQRHQRHAVLLDRARQPVDRRWPASRGRGRPPVASAWSGVAGCLVAARPGLPGPGDSTIPVRDNCLISAVVIRSFLATITSMLRSAISW